MRHWPDERDVRPQQPGRSRSPSSTCRLGIWANGLLQGHVAVRIDCVYRSYLNAAVAIVAANITRSFCLAGLFPKAAEPAFGCRRPDSSH